MKYQCAKYLLKAIFGFLKLREKCNRVASLCFKTSIMSNENKKNLSFINSDEKEILSFINSAHMVVSTAYAMAYRPVGEPVKKKMR